jgi:DNA-binding response OmpR family regulator
VDRKKILVVDDDPEFRSLLCEILAEGDYATVTAENGVAGVEAAKRELPDMILLDVQMPGMDGYEVTEAVRKEKDLDATPIVLVTVQSKVSEVVKGLKLGADDHVTKPFHTDEVLVRVKSLFERGRQA